VSGPGASALLAQAIGVDLHPSAFPVGAAAVTTAAHLNLVLWRREADVFDLLPSRSFAGAFWHWLTEIGAETGLRIEATGP
jgi:sarcosine oxidase subunit gamma